MKKIDATEFNSALMAMEEASTLIASVRNGIVQRDDALPSVRRARWFSESIGGSDNPEERRLFQTNMYPVGAKQRLVDLLCSMKNNKSSCCRCNDSKLYYRHEESFLLMLVSLSLDSFLSSEQQ